MFSSDAGLFFCLRRFFKSQPLQVVLNLSLPFGFVEFGGFFGCGGFGAGCGFLAFFSAFFGGGGVSAECCCRCRPQRMLELGDSASGVGAGFVSSTSFLLLKVKLPEEIFVSVAVGWG